MCNVARQKLIDVRTLYLTIKGRDALVTIKALAQEHEQHLTERVGFENRQVLLSSLACFASG